MYSFVKQAWHVVEPNTPYVDNWHIGCICEHLQAMSNLEIRKLIVNIPPRHAKSLIASVFWFCWSWARDPSSRWMYSSYGEDLASRDSVKCRDIIVSPWFRERWGKKFSLKNDQNVKTWFANDQQGYRIATSVEGKAIGHGGDYIIADDPHNIKEARSAYKRQGVIDWWTQGMSTRGNDPATARFLIVMQRLHERDLTGYTLSEKLGYEHLCLPAEFERSRVHYSIPTTPGEKLPRDGILATSLQRDEAKCAEAYRQRRTIIRDPRTEEGQPLWPSRFGEVQIADWKNTLRDGWAGQGQQRPSPPDGTVFKKDYFRYFDVEMRNGEPHVVFGGDLVSPHLRTWVKVSDLRFFQCIDTATSDDEEAAYTAVGTYALTPSKRLLVWNVWRMRLTVPELFPAIHALKNGPIFIRRNAGERPRFDVVGQWPKPLMFQAVESKSSGIGLIQSGWAEGSPFHELKADADKVERAGPVATMYLNGLVFHNRGEDWLPDFEDELLSFPSGAFKDMADVTAYAGYLVTHEKMSGLTVRDDQIVVDGQEELFARQEEATSDTVTVRGYGEDLVIQFDDD